MPIATRVSVRDRLPASVADRGRPRSRRQYCWSPIATALAPVVVLKLPSAVLKAPFAVLLSPMAVAPVAPVAIWLPVPIAVLKPAAAKVCREPAPPLPIAVELIPLASRVVTERGGIGGRRRRACADGGRGDARGLGATGGGIVAAERHGAGAVGG